MSKLAWKGKGRWSPSPFLKKAHGTDGQFTLNGALTLFFVMLLLVLFISVLGVINTSMKLHSVAAELSRYIEIRGRVDSAVYTELDRLAGVAGVTVTGREITGTVYGTKIQFGSEFTVHLTTTGNIGVGGVLSMPIQLETHVTGRSERYWK